MVYALLGGKVLHASGYLIGTGYQVLGGELLCCIVADIVTVLQVRRPLGLQVLLYVVFGGIFHECVRHGYGNVRFSFKFRFHIRVSIRLRFRFWVQVRITVRVRVRVRARVRVWRRLTVSVRVRVSGYCWG